MANYEVSYGKSLRYTVGVIAAIVLMIYLTIAVPYFWCFTVGAPVFCAMWFAVHCTLLGMD